MSHPAKVETDAAYPLPGHMRAWVLGDPGQLSLVDKPIPMPGRAEVLVHIDAVAICATDLEIIHHGAPALIGSPGSSAAVCIPVDEQYPSSARNLVVVSTKENGRHRWFAMSRPSMLPLKYSTLRTRSQTKLNGRPVSSAVLGAGGSAIGLEAGAETGAITAIGVRLCHGPV